MIGMTVGGHQAVLHIQSVQFDVHHGSSYDAFLQPDTVFSTNAVNVRLSAVAPGATDGRVGNALFQTAGWHVFKRENGYLVLPPVARADMLWMAECDAGFAETRIWIDATCREDRRIFDGLVEYAMRIVLRLVMMHRFLETTQSLLIHTAALCIDGRNYLFPGISGAGKSTLCKQFLDHQDCQIVNDDRMLVRGDGNGNGNGWTAWGTPWPGELQIALNQHAPLAGLCFLEKSDRTALEPLSPQQALERLLPVVSIPWYDARLVPIGLDLCERLVTENPVHVFRFRPDQTAVEAVLALAGR